MGVALYCRVSTKSQNIETQLKALKDYSVRNGIKGLRIYEDVGVSGAKDSRPQLDLLLRDLREGQIETVLVYKIDRLGRSLKHLLDLLAEFKNRKVRLISIADNIDTRNENPMSRAFWQVLGVFAEFERAIIRDRVMSGLERARAEGKRLGRPVGATDKRKRSVSGYHLRYAGTKIESRRLGKRNKQEAQNNDANRTNFNCRRHSEAAEDC